MKTLTMMQPASFSREGNLQLPEQGIKGRDLLFVQAVGCQINSLHVASATKHTGEYRNIQEGQTEGDEAGYNSGFQKSE